jgi:hypothetical protein
MTACAGDNKAELKISDATAEVGTLNFILLCEPSALSPDTPISDTDIPAIIDAAEENADRAEAAVAHYPYINTVNKNWMVWDAETGAFVDTGIRAEGIDGEGSVQSVNGVLPDVGGNVMLSLASITHDPLLTANGGTGNPFGYIQTGLKSGETAGLQSTAEGKDNKAGMYAHAEGWDNNASGQDSHAEGYSNTASGLHSHAEGIETTASAQGTHAGGCGTVAGYSYQTAIGKYNSNQSDTLFEVGNGASNNSRSNAIAVKTDGRITKGANNAFASAANIADVIEMTRTMTALRSKGTHVYVVADDLTYEVTADAGIASSGTLIPNTNAVVWTAAGGYEKLNSDLANKHGSLDWAHTVSIPVPGNFIPTTDGVAYMYALSASAGRAYVYIFDNHIGRIIDICDVNASNANSAVAFSCELSKNRSYACDGLNVIGNASIFVPYT